MGFNPKIFKAMREYHEHGFDVIAHLLYSDGARHSVHIRKFNFDPDGHVKSLSVFDPIGGDIREIGAKTFVEYVTNAAAPSLANGVYHGKYMLAIKVPPP